MARIYILDMDALSVMNLWLYLEKDGHQISLAAHCATALDHIFRDPPSLLIAEASDARGSWLCKRLKEHSKTKDIPVVLISQPGDIKIGEDKLREAMRNQYGCDDYLSKPLDEARVRKVVRQLLAKA